MSENKNAPFNEEENGVVSAFEQGSEKPSAPAGEYDIFDLEGIDELFKEKKQEIIETAEEQVEEKVAPPQDDEGVNNVTSVLPPYRRETVERTTEDVKELSRKRNHDSYHSEIISESLVDDDMYKEPELGMDIDELLKTLGLDDSFAEEKAEKSSEDGETKVLDTKAIAASDMKAEADEGKTQVINIETALGDNGDGFETKHFEVQEKAEKDISSTRYFNLKNHLKHDKAEVEKKLKASRKNLMQNFRVLSKNKGEDEAILEAAPTGDGKGSVMDNISAEEGEDLFDAVEKAQKKKRKHSREDKKQAVIIGKAALDDLKKTEKAQKTSLVILGAILVVSLVLAFLPGAFTKMPAPPSAAIFVIFNILALVGTVVAAKNYFRSGALSLYYMAPDEDTCLVISAAFVLIHDILSVIFSSKLQLSELKMYTSVVVFAAIMRVTCDFFRTKTALGGIKTLIKGDGIQSVQTVAGRNDSVALAQGLSKNGVPKLLYCAETNMDEGINTDISAIKKEDKYYSISSVAVIGVSLVAGVVFALRNRDLISFVTAFLSCMSITLPVMSDTAASVMSYIENKKLSKIKAAATSYETIREIGKSGAVILDVKDIFVGKVAKFRRVPGAKYSQSDSVVFVAATLKKAGSVLSDCFDELIEELEITLPEAEDFAYEEKLGYSCWIADRRVLLGNRQMLIEHSIPAPTEYEEKQYGGKSSVMYLVVEGEIAATFTVSYKVISKAKASARNFASTGLVLMLTSKEACLHEQTVSVALGLEITSVKLITQKGNAIMQRYKENKDLRKSVGVFCLKNSGAPLTLVSAAHGIYASNRFIFIVHIISQIAAAVFMLLAVLFNMSIFFSPLTIILYLLFWSSVSVAITQRNSIIKFISERRIFTKWQK